MVRKKRNVFKFLVGITLSTIFSVLAYNIATDKVAYMVAYVHLDTQWQWTLKNTIDTYIPNTMRGNFSLMDQYPEYKFTFEGAYRYYLMKTYYPTDYARLKTYVSRGQWSFGGLVDGCDVNIPSAEALVRQIMYGNMYIADEFGADKKSVEILLPDCFGFGYALPTIGAHCGLKGFSTQKFDRWGGFISIPFTIGRWQGVDGNSLISCLRPGDYNDNKAEIRAIDGDTLKARTGIWATYDYVGTGDQGGAPSATGIADMITRQRANVAGQIQMVSTPSDQIYKDISANPTLANGLRTYNGELLMTTHGSGCYTSYAYMKQKNRMNELAGGNAEGASVMANWLKQTPYQRDKIWFAWFRFLSHQMHDDLTGTSIASAYTQYSYPAEDSSYREFNQVLGEANTAVATTLNTQVKAGNVAVVVFNQLAIAREDVVEATVDFGTAAPVDVKVFDQTGVECPAQKLSVTGQSVKFAFVAKLPPVSYTVFEVQPAAAANAVNPNLSITTSQLNNSLYTVSIDANGDISQILDKKTGKNLLTAPVQLEGRNDQGQTFAAWEVIYADVSSTPKWAVTQGAVKTIAESGPARVSLKVVRTQNGSTFTQYIRLGAGNAGSQIVVDNNIVWNSTGTLLKAAFPTSCTNTNATWDLGIGTISRGDMKSNLYEVPGQQWADITNTDGSYGVSILNDCKYGWHKSGSKLYLTLIHSPSGGGYNYPGDLGLVHTFKYAIYGHAQSWTNGTVWEAARLNQPAIAFQAASNAGTVGKSISMLSLSDPSKFAIMAIKRAEKSDDYVIRVRELQGTGATNLRITMNSNITAATEWNGAEDPLGAITSSGPNLTFDLKKYQMRTFAVKLSGAVGVQKGGMTGYYQKSDSRFIHFFAGKNRPVSMSLGANEKVKSMTVVDMLGRIVWKLSDVGIANRAGVINEVRWNGEGSAGIQGFGAGSYVVNVATDVGNVSASLLTVR